MRFVRALLVLLAASVVAGCGDGRTAPTESDVAGAKKTVRACAAGSIRPVRDAGTSYAAVVQERADAYRTPGTSRLASFGPENVNDVPTAIHGTNRPLLGRAVSNGCIRVRNDLLRRLFRRTLAGTPVTVRA